MCLQKLLKPYWASPSPCLMLGKEQTQACFPEHVNRRGYLLTPRTVFTWARSALSPRPQYAGRAMGAA